MNSRKYNLTKDFVFLSGVYLSTIMVFSSYFSVLLFFNRDNVGIFLSFVIMVIYFIALAAILALASYALKPDRSLLTGVNQDDKSLTLINSADRALKEASLKDFLYGTPSVGSSYYPAIASTILPVSKILLNPKILSILFSVAIISAIGTKMVLGVFNILVISLIFLMLYLSNIFWFLFYNRYTYRNALYVLKSQNEPKLATMNYAGEYILDQIKSSDIQKLIPCLPNSSIDGFYRANISLTDLFYESYNISRTLNDGLVDGSLDPSLFDSDINTLRYINNEFVIKTIDKTKKFLSTHKDNIGVAKSIYLKDISPGIASEIHALSKSIALIRDNIKTAKKAHNELLKESIKADGAFKELVNEKTLIKTEFSDFYGLHFDSLKNKVAAKNIVASTLPELEEALAKTTDSEVKTRIKSQVEYVKNFVRSLASNTPESDERKVDQIDKMNNDPLSISNIDASDVLNSDVDALIERQRMYIDSYDQSL